MYCNLFSKKIQQKQTALREGGNYCRHYLKVKVAQNDNSIAFTLSCRQDFASWAEAHCEKSKGVSLK